MGRFGEPDRSLEKRDPLPQVPGSMRSGQRFFAKLREIMRRNLHGTCFACAMPISTAAADASSHCETDQIKARVASPHWLTLEP